MDGSDPLNRSRDLLPEPRLSVATRGGVASIGGLDGHAPFIEATMVMPGAATDVRWNPSTNLVHVLGEDGSRPSIYVLEPHGNTVFADAELPLAPVAWDLDVSAARADHTARHVLPAVPDGHAGVVASAGHGRRIPPCPGGGIELDHRAQRSGAADARLVQAAGMSSLGVVVLRCRRVSAG